MEITLTALHFVYLAGVIVTLACMIARKDCVIPCAVFTFLAGVVNSGSLLGGASASYNALVFAGGEFFSTILTISVMVTMAKQMGDMGTDRVLVAPLAKLSKSPMVMFLILGCAMVFAPAVQANSVVEAIRVSFDVPGWIVGVIFAVIMAVVLVGGIKSISSFAEKVVPLMALAYVIGSIFILVKFGSNIPHVFAMIFEYAFTPMAATGGFAGSTVMLASVGAWPAACTPMRPAPAWRRWPTPPLPPTIR